MYTALKGNAGRQTSIYLQLMYNGEDLFTGYNEAAESCRMDGGDDCALGFRLSVYCFNLLWIYSFCRCAVVRIVCDV